MDERWQHVKNVLGAALEHSPDEREAFVREACGGDEGLRGEVESLLAVQPDISQFLAHPASIEETAATALAPGDHLGPYEVLSLLGAGGMGEVYEAFDPRLKRTVAIKLVPGGDPRAQARLSREARHASALSHPNVCVVHEIGDADGVAYIVMERVRGRALADVIPEQGLTVDVALGYALQIAGALAHAHEHGLVHRDLKSANVMVTYEGLVKVLDFGLARRADETRATATGDADNRGEAAAMEAGTGGTSARTAAGTIAGTLGYMAPEVLRGQPADARSDVWAAGVVMHEMLTGDRPFGGETGFELREAILAGNARPLPARVPSALAAVVRRCLDKDAASRYASGRELEAALENVVLAARRVRLRSLIARPKVAVPIVLLAAVLGAVAYRLQTQAGRERWARETALPEIARLTEQGRIDAAFKLARQAESYLPGDPALGRLLRELTVPISVETDPPGADVLARSYLAGDDTWESLGTTPIVEQRIPFGYFRFRVARDGFDPVEGAFAPQLNEVIRFTLDRPGVRPPGMVRVRGGPVQAFGGHQANVDDFWLDTYEVTNRDFKQFVDHGYARPDYWKHPFAVDGRKLRWEEALARFVDSTGHPGPSTWTGGTYPEGQADFPVRGVSWYEAAAYAEFVGKSLPTIYHWHRAAGDLIFTDILSRSNFGGKEPARVGSYQGIAPFGNYDMAGNVKEWCWNRTGGRRYILGGAWNEPTYMFVRDEDAHPPFDRAPTHGFRCAKYPAPLPPALLDAVESPRRDYTKEKPIPDEVFESYRSFYAYDRGDLKAVIESVDEAPDWRVEKVTFNAAYGGERMAAYLFLPRNAAPPYQTVIWFPGVYARIFKSSADLGVTFYFDFLPRGGRAVLFPIYKGTYERGATTARSGPNAWRDEVIQRSKDLGRSIDYLETRPDIDASRLAYYGFSWGASEGVVLTAIENRLETAVLLAGGLSESKTPAAADPFHFAPRVQLPLLMLNGRGDFGYPLETSAAPLFRLLGTPERHKRLAVFESGHVPPPIEVSREVVSWLDRYLGPVSAGKDALRPVP